MKTLDDKLIEEVYEENINSIDEVRYSQDVLYFDNLFDNMGFAKDYIKKNYSKIYEICKDTMKSEEYRLELITKKEKYTFMFHATIASLDMLEQLYYTAQSNDPEVYHARQAIIKDRSEKNIIDLWVYYIGGDDYIQNPYGELIGEINERGMKIINDLREFKEKRYK
jgi:hypothetical protein